MAEVYLPGESIVPGSSNASGVKIIGCGIDTRDGELFAIQAGELKRNNGKTYLAVHSKRYVPENGDRVLGIVVGKMGEYWKVDLGSAHLGLVHFLSFEGATKRNRPDVKNGDLIYAQVVRACRHMEATLTCVDGEGKARGMGKIPSSGLVFRAPIHLIRRILSPTSQLLKLIGKDYKFEIISGLNGRVCIRSEEPKTVIIIRNAILKSEWVLESDIPAFIETEIRRVSGFDVPMPPIDTDMNDVNEES